MIIIIISYYYYINFLLNNILLNVTFPHAFMKGHHQGTSSDPKTWYLSRLLNTSEDPECRLNLAKAKESLWSSHIHPRLQKFKKIHRNLSHPIYQNPRLLQNLRLSTSFLPSCHLDNFLIQLLSCYESRHKPF